MLWLPRASAAAAERGRGVRCDGVRVLRRSTSRRSTTRRRPSMSSSSTPISRRTKQSGRSWLTSGSAAATATGRATETAAAATRAAAAARRRRRRRRRRRLTNRRRSARCLCSAHACSACMRHKRTRLRTHVLLWCCGAGCAADKARENATSARCVQEIQDMTSTDLVNLRRTLYLTIMSSATFEEAGHKLLKLRLPPGQEAEVCAIILECCGQEKTYMNFYGLLAQRFCSRMVAYAYAPALRPSSTLSTTAARVCRVGFAWLSARQGTQKRAFVQRSVCVRACVSVQRPSAASVRSSTTPAAVSLGVFAPAVAPVDAPTPTAEAAHARRHTRPPPAVPVRERVDSALPVHGTCVPCCAVLPPAPRSGVLLLHSGAAAQASAQHAPVPAGHLPRLLVRGCRPADTGAWPTRHAGCACGSGKAYILSPKSCAVMPAEQKHALTLPDPGAAHRLFQSRLLRS